MYSFSPHAWNPGDTVSSAELNRIEQAVATIAAASTTGPQGPPGPTGPAGPPGPLSSGAVTSVVGATGDVAGSQIAADPALRAAFVAGSVYNNDGVTKSTTKTLHVVLTADGLDIQDLIIQ